MSTLLLTLALLTIPVGWVWGWVELGRCWRVSTTVSKPSDTQRSTDSAPIPPIPPTPDNHFVPRRLHVFPDIQAHKSYYHRKGKKR